MYFFARITHFVYATFALALGAPKGFCFNKSPEKTAGVLFARRGLRALAKCGHSDEQNVSFAANAQIMKIYFFAWDLISIPDFFRRFSKNL